MTATPFLLPPLPLSGPYFPWGNFGSLEYSSFGALTRLDGMMNNSAKADLFWFNWLLAEARSSNLIEGTVTTFDEIMGENAGLVVPVARKDDVQEVLNYREAMLSGLAGIENGRDLSLSFVKALHAELIRGARGENKTPGEWRHVQVHIGIPGESLEKALYIPPEPINLPQLLDNWALFVARNDINPVIQAAVMHAQFEMIHPFLDGNGRTGRLLISLFLAKKGVLHTPCFYMSAYLQRHRHAYYEALSRISRHGDWDTWIRFFLNAVVEHSTANSILLTKMSDLYEQSKRSFADVTASASAVLVLDYIFRKPIFTVPDLSRSVGITRQLGLNIVGRLSDSGFVERIEPGTGRKPAIWKFSRLVDLLAE